MQVLLPLKEFAAVKQRLAGVLTAAERAQLFQAMVADVLTVLTAHPAVERVVICSRDHSAVWLARYYEVEFLDETALLARDPQGGVHRHDLNAAVNAAARRFAAAGSTDLLVVHGDLPLLHSDDISTLLDCHRAAVGAAITIAPDRRNSGTNLLAWRPLQIAPGIGFSASYGVDSLQRHCAQARALGATLNVCQLAGARCDIDEPEDLLLLLDRQPRDTAASSLAFLRDSGIAERLYTMQHSANIVYAGDDHDCA